VLTLGVKVKFHGHNPAAAEALKTGTEGARGVGGSEEGLTNFLGPGVLSMEIFLQI